MGWMTPFDRIEAASSCNRSGSNTRRGWTGLASISSMRMLVGVCAAGAGSAILSVTGGLEGNRAVSPRPKALRGASCGLFIGKYLLGQLDITFSSLGANIVAQYGLAVARSLGEANIPRDYGLKDFTFEEIAQVLSHLAGQRGPVIEHSKQDTFDLKAVFKGI